MSCYILSILFFFFNATATTEIYTLSLHDALPIGARKPHHRARLLLVRLDHLGVEPRSEEHTSNSSHRTISYAVFCLKKKKIGNALVAIANVIEKDICFELS